MSQLIKTQLDFSNKFTSKASIEDIIFLLYCLIYPYFWKNIIYSVLLFSILALMYMHKVINSISLYEFRKSIAAK